MRTVTFKIDGMRCEACADTIKRRLAATAGVRAGDVSFKDGSARVLYQPEALGEEQLAALVERAGYRVVDRT
jgi:copper chaperone CopZ